MKSTGEPELGFIAQDVEKIYPLLVKSHGEGMKSLNYVGLIAPMVEAIKELNQKCSASTSENELEQLRAENRALARRLDVLEGKQQPPSRPYN